MKDSVSDNEDRAGRFTKTSRSQAIIAFVTEIIADLEKKGA